jgi:hypothetical protein
MLDYINGPDAVLAMLCDNCRLHQIAYASTPITDHTPLWMAPSPRSPEVRKERQRSSWLSLETYLLASAVAARAVLKVRHGALGIRVREERSESSFTHQSK